MVIGNSLLVACPGKGGGMCPPPGPLYKAALRPNTQLLYCHRRVRSSCPSVLLCSVSTFALSHNGYIVVFIPPYRVAQRVR